jgi:hypothetical protein
MGRESWETIGYGERIMGDYRVWGVNTTVRIYLSLDVICDVSIQVVRSVVVYLDR